MSEGLSRREFAFLLGASAGAVASWPGPARASVSKGEAPDLVQLNSNENPYGPSATPRGRPSAWTSTGSAGATSRRRPTS